MEQHVAEWLGAYLDGELHGPKMAQVEAHLAGCEQCRAELDELRSLSKLLLVEVPEMEFKPADRFAAGVVLQLSRDQDPKPAGPTAELLFWLIPLALLSGWITVQMAFFLNDFLLGLGLTNLLGNVPPWLLPRLASAGWFDPILGWLNAALVQANPAFAGSLETTHTVLGYLGRNVVQIAFCLMYVAWMAAWFARRQSTSTGN